ncbi:MAG TPA: DUF4870 domain-containing protein [Anoxybacillus sp.]|jgi:CHASE2 domain-containing sensor protein|nr:DUF4870 domain-containing protein [Anoxybacillus sp.]
MNANKVLSSLCYFSVFFAGFIFPIIVYFVSDDVDVKQHAKKALISHVIPLITVVFFGILAITVGAFNQAGFPDAIPGIAFLGVIIAAIINFIVIIWNIVKGIQVLKGV